MRFRFHPNCIDRFASTLPFWCVFDCPHWNVRKQKTCTLWRMLNSKLQKNTYSLRQKLLGHFHSTLFFHFWPVSWSSQCCLSHLALPNLADQHWEGKKMANCPKNFDWDCTGYFVFLHLFKRFTTMGTHIRRLIYQVSFFIFFFYCLFMASTNKAVILSYLVIPNFSWWNDSIFVILYETILINISRHGNMESFRRFCQLRHCFLQG